MICPECRKDWEEQEYAVFCQKCGHTLIWQPMCCYNKWPLNYNFCPKCGKAINYSVKEK